MDKFSHLHLFQQYAIDCFSNINVKQIMKTISDQVQSNLSVYFNSVSVVCLQMQYQGWLKKRAKLLLYTITEQNNQYRQVCFISVLIRNQIGLQNLLLQIASIQTSYCMYAIQNCLSEMVRTRCILDTCLSTVVASSFCLNL